MENSRENKEVLQKTNTKHELKDHSDENQILITELVEMGFAKSLVLQVILFNLYIIKIKCYTLYLYLDCKKCRRCT